MERNASMTGRTCMITGATSGIGHATAIELAKMGADVVLVCCDRGRAEETAAEIRALNGHARVDVMLADLSSQQAIRRLARDYLATDRPLHVLVNNAGVVN